MSGKALAAAYRNPKRKRGNDLKTEGILAHASGYDGNATIKATTQLINID